MADAGIIDVVHRISYEITGQNAVVAIQRQFQSNAEAIARNTASLVRLNTQLAATSDPRRQELLRQAIANRTRAINEQQQAIQRTIQTDRQFQQTLQREIGIINEMNGRLRSLREARDAATSPAAIRNYTRQINEVERQQRRLLGGGALGGVGNALLTGLGIGTGTAVAFTAVNKLKELVTEGQQFAAEIEGVRVAFDRINRATLLDELRKATKNTVSDLELMKQAVQYNNLGLPVNRLGTALEFARRRAKETGVDVNYLIKSLVDGIGRQSILKVDNLGISMQAVRKEVARTGDFATALFNIIEQGLKDAGPELDTFAERQARITANFENNQAAIGSYFNFIKEGFIALGTDILSGSVNPSNLLSGTNVTLLGAITKARFEAEREAAAQQNAVNVIYERDYKQFLGNIGSLDINSRNERLDQAEKFYNDDLARAKTYYGDFLAGYSIYSRLQTKAYISLRDQITKTPLNVVGITADNISSATKNQLDQAVATLEGQKGDLPAGAEVDDINRRLEIVKAQLKKFNAEGDKDAESRLNKQQALSEGLKKSLLDLDKRRSELLSKGEVETSQTIERQVIEARDAELQKIDIEEQAAIRKKEQTQVTEALFAEIRQRIRDNADLEYLAKNKDFLEKLTKQQNDFDLSLARLELNQVRDEQALPGGNTIERRVAIAEKERNVELNENRKKFDDLAQQAKDLGEPLEKIEEDRQKAVEVILEKGYRRAIELEQDYLRQRYQIIEEAAKLSINAFEADSIENRQDANIPGNAAGTDRRLNALDLTSSLASNRRNQDSVFEKLDVAQDNLRRVSNYAGATQQDIDNATNEVNALLIELQRLREASIKTNTELDSLLGKGDVDKSGEHILFSGNWKADFIDAIDLYGQVAQAATTAYNDMASAKQEQLSKEIEYQQYAISQAQILAERGNTEALKIEEERLAELEKQQRESAQEQRVINSGLTLSYAIAAVARAALEGGGYASIATVAAVIAALGAGYAFVQSFSQKGYKDGIVDLEGPGTTKSDSIPARLSRGESVMTAEATAKYKPILEMMNEGKFAMPMFPVYIPTPPKDGDSGYVTKGEFKGFGKKLDALTEAVYNTQTKVNVHQNINKNGVAQIVETERTNDQRRFR